MLRLCVTLLLLTFAFQFTQAQSCNKRYKSDGYNPDYRNESAYGKKSAIYAEFQNQFDGFTINYDMRFSNRLNSGPGFRIGIGTERFTSDDNVPVTTESLVIPAGVNYLIGNRRHSLEAGIGANFKFDTAFDDIEEGWHGNAFLNVGYRFKPIRNGVVFRWSWTPLIDLDGMDLGFSTWSIGWGF